MRLRCRFVIGAHHSAEQLHSEKLKAGHRFIEDMGRQGWDWQGELALTGGPWTATPVANIPQRPVNQRASKGRYKHEWILLESKAVFRLLESKS